MISVTTLTKTFQSNDSVHVAVDGISFENPAGSFLTLLGPSGCGKSTTLRCIAGLESPDDGRIELDGQLAYSRADRVDLPSARRSIGMIFQSYAVWPHMTVYENVEYPLRRLGVKSSERRRRVSNVLEMVGLGEFADRPAPYLSGGQQQRVAFARAVVAEPKVMLLDEPLSNLDAALRKDLRAYLREMYERLGLTVLYVTHDQDEALSLSDTVALMSHGQILEFGPPEDIYNRPQTEFGARFLGSANLLPGIVSERRNGHAVAKTSFGSVAYTGQLAERAKPGDSILLMVRPEYLLLREPAQTALAGAENSFEATVVRTVFLGASTEVQLDAGAETPINAQVQGHFSFREGDRVGVDSRAVQWHGVVPTPQAELEEGPAMNTPARL
jgi:iron(III) transport system ATP-binding protein